MSYVWNGSNALRRPEGERVAPGEAFEPTEAEQRAFGDLIETVDDPGEDESDEDGGEEAEDLPDPPFDPGEHTVNGLREHLDENEYSALEREALEAAEHDGENRTTALEAITGIR